MSKVLSFKLRDRLEYSFPVPELSKVILSFRHGVGQKIALHASPTARNSGLQISTFSFLSSSFFLPK